jgi:hypothetical protein
VHALLQFFLDAADLPVSQGLLGLLGFVLLKLGQGRNSVESLGFEAFEVGAHFVQAGGCFESGLGQQYVSWLQFAQHAVFVF